MKIFFKKKKVKFIPAVCPKCNGNLEIDSNLEIAFCSNCGLRCLIDESLGKKEKQSKFDKIICFIERQQSIIREEKKEKEFKKQKQEEKDELELKKIKLILVSFIVLCIIYAVISFII